MKNVLRTNLAIVLMILAGIFNNASGATGIAAGDLTYVHVSDSTYRFILRIYTDCSGLQPPATVPLCASNTCTNNAFSVTMTQYGSSVNKGPGCPQYKTTCDSPGSTLPGYKEQLYSAMITLPLRCANWKFFVNIVGRNSVTNLANPTSNSIYFETVFNNTISHNNSSPFFATSALVYAGQNGSTVNNISAIDPDGDSLRIQVIQPLTGASTCSSTPVPATFNTVTPPYNITNNPVQTNNTFTLNSSNGQYAFTSSTLGFSNMAVRVSEYRNGVFIGSAMRELQITTFPLLSSSVHNYNLNFGCGQTGTNLSMVYGCPTQNLSFCFDVKGTNGGVFTVTDDTPYSLPGASLTYTNQGTDSVRAVFNWTPGVNDVGYHEIRILVKDSTCAPPGILWTTVYRLGITVWGKTSTNNDTVMCPNGSIQLNAKGGNAYSWTILPGGSAGSLSATNIANPVATPTVTTTYVVTTTGNSICPNMNKDTVTITVLPLSSVSYASVKIFVSPDSNINVGDTATFNAAPTNCANPFYQWFIDGKAVVGATQSIYKTSTLIDNQKLWCVLTCKDSCPSPMDTFSNTITMHVSGSVKNVGQLKNIHLYPNPNNGVFTVTLGDDGPGRNKAQIEVRNVYGQLVYSRSTTENTEQLKLDYLSPGLYILAVRTESNIGTTSFIIRK